MHYDEFRDRFQDGLREVGLTYRSKSSLSGKNSAIVWKSVSFSKREALSSMTQAAIRQSAVLLIVLPLFRRVR